MPARNPPFPRVGFLVHQGPEEMGCFSTTRRWPEAIARAASDPFSTLPPVTPDQLNVPPGPAEMPCGTEGLRMMAMPRWRRRVALGLLALALVALAGFTVRRKKRHHHHHAREPAVADYTHDIKPILAARCCRCHGPTRHKAGLRLDTAAAIRKGSDSGAVIVPGDSVNSLLIAAVTGAGDTTRMPPAGEPLADREIALLKSWIDHGAPMPDDARPQPAGSDHWAFRSPARPPVPAVRPTDPARNPVDAFLAVERHKRGLTPSPPIDRGLWLRRVSIDLVGLPPTREELRTFLADASEDAYEKAVDRLLASPHYGERWGRHWMDVWRYSDPDGRKLKKDIWWSNEHIWRWRDWIVRSLNADKGYDRMVLEMLAGDEAAPGDLEALAATGFLVRNWFKLNRNIWLNNTVEHTGKAFLGLTINCARCHDHKFDPISQKDYYQFRAFFQPHDIRTEPLCGGTGCPGGSVTHAYDARPDEPTWILVRGDEKTPDRATPITPGVPAALGGLAVCIQPIQGPPASTGRRLALARWICDRHNPLAARVAVNHVWARHFGRPLVENVADFGRRSGPPAQQPLLDWLAVEFMAHDWSMKWLHRLLLTSAAYRMQSAAGASAQADPDNRYYCRMNPRRMEAEVVRDALLHLAGTLDPAMGGPPLDCLAGPDSPRRSLYHRHSREDKMAFLATFDAPSTEECYRRQESIVPQQALALENSPFVWDQARRIARRLAATAPRAIVTAAFEHLLGRQPTGAELQACERFLIHQERLLAYPSRLTAFPACPPAKVRPTDDPRQQAREHLIHALLNHNDFITVR
jgi:hypothetical protein